MEKEIYIKKGWLFIPVCATYGELPFGGKKNNRMLEIFCRENNSETKLFEFQIPAGEAEDETYPVSYYARFPVKQFTDKTLILRGDLGKAFFDGIRRISTCGRQQLRAAVLTKVHKICSTHL